MNGVTEFKYVNHDKYKIEYLQQWFTVHVTYKRIKYLNESGFLKQQLIKNHSPMIIT